MTQDRTVEEQIEPRLLDLAHETRLSGEFPIESLEIDDVVELQTLNSTYKFRILDSEGRRRRVQLSGTNSRFQGPFEAYLEGACHGKIILNPGSIALNSGVAFGSFDGKYLFTSEVKSIVVNGHRIAPLS